MTFRRPSLFAVADLHLPGGQKKPMDVFGSHWKDHFERISKDWRQRVAPEDLVLIPGDISWAMQLSEALPDLEDIAALPGRILLLRGNHDYWWGSLTQLRAALPENMHAIQNDAYDAGFCVVCGTRGWEIPPEKGADPQNVKVYEREIGRLRLSLAAAARITRGRPLIAMMHYPPLYPEMRERGTEMSRLLTEAGVKRCVYGHLHGPHTRKGLHETVDGVRYDLTSCDSLGFRLLDVTPENSNEGSEGSGDSISAN
ncbi:MAG: metallophosphoesterase [Clostridiales bacterium]|nr:metallophosphoesterase [Clostridiales bacterium]